MRELAQDILDGWPVDYGRGIPFLGLNAAEVLMNCVADTDGDYAEIGSAWGGSAVMAAMAMEAAGRPGIVVCVDPFSKESEIKGLDKKLDQFWSTMIHYGIHQRIFAFKQYNPPFPLAAYFHMFSVSLIDGNHYGDSPADDFNELTKRTTEYLLIDNVEIVDVNYVVEQALETNDWEEYKTVEYESNAHKDKTVKFVALRRTKNENIKTSN